MSARPSRFWRAAWLIRPWRKISKIGEINSYSLLPAFTEPYRKGWQLAVEEINAAGGINGKKLVVISKDDGGKPADAQTAANELVSSEGVAMLTGTFLSNIGLAVSDFANQKKVFFLAAEPLTDAVTWSKGNKYTFRLRPSNYMQAAMLVEAASKLPAKRWATIAPNYEYGQSAVAVFKKLMSEKRPDIQWGRRAVAAAGQDRRGSGGASRCRGQSRGDPQRHLRRRSREARARR
ncbi:ABC-type branched-subunit amino acid transport system substrate-binding protein [Bradyrhizobium sp. LM6.11]